ncbi:protein FADD isoform X1 [Corythoichthys intestinalis]|uniref:protein FADD isoform X1 n=1 Tax=Corythoichthys intestinalis TaxID=161448 RepID=UPI0025A65BFE|nr:protein FADD isoform X1 [Corythoichthys intestinalis]
MSSSRFKALLLDISRELTAEQLECIKYLCEHKVGRRVSETIDSGFRLFQCLIERGELDQENRETLSELLKQIHRQDLSDKLNSFQSPPHECALTQPSEPERAKLDIATNVIAENLGRNWRRLGRQLGLSESKLDSVSTRHPNDLDETARELLKEWRKSRGSEVCANDLIRALRACHQNLTADKVEDAWMIPQ